MKIEERTTSFIVGLYSLYDTVFSTTSTIFKIFLGAWISRSIQSVRTVILYRDTKIKAKNINFLSLIFLFGMENEAKNFHHVEISWSENFSEFCCKFS